MGEDLVDLKTRYPILNRMPDDVEGALTLCGAMECLQRPLIAFVRLAEGQLFKQCLEVPIPVRFVIVILVSFQKFHFENLLDKKKNRLEIENDL